MTKPDLEVETCPACHRPAHASETGDDGLHPGCAPSPSFYHASGVTLSCPGRGRYGLPTFGVWASSTDEAAWLVERIVLCDRRSTDGMLWRVEGTLRSGIESWSFTVQMTTTGPTLAIVH